MKKNRNGSFSYSGKLSKVLLRMKLTFVLLLCVMSQVFALASAQTVSLKKQNASLEEILWELKEKTQLVFMYSDEDIASERNRYRHEKYAGRCDIEQMPGRYRFEIRPGE